MSKIRLPQTRWEKCLLTQRKRNIRVPGDSETLTQIHYMLVHPNYQRQGIAGKMLELIKEKYKDYLYIESMPKDKSNVPLYVKHRFTMTENGAAIQISNYSNAQ